MFEKLQQDYDAVQEDSKIILSMATIQLKNSPCSWFRKKKKLQHFCI
jgi:hypothetical protein